MIVTHSFMGQVWTDLNSPSKEELDSLILAQNIDPIIAKDLATPTPKQYAKEFGKVIYAVIHIPFFKHSQSLNLEQEIDFVINENGLITTRYESIDALHHFAKQIEVNEILNKNNEAHLFFGLMKEIYTFLFDEVEYLKDWIKETEKNIFGNREREMVFSISATARNVLSFRRIVYPHKAVLENIGLIGKDNFGGNFNKEIRLLLDEWERLILEIKNISDMLDELRKTNDSILSTKQNEIMRQLTIIGSVVLPLTVIGQIFGLSITRFPFKENPYAFWVILGLMAFVMICSFAYARFKKWL